MRNIFHYIFSILILWIVGIKVSPYIDGLDPVSWGAILLGVFGVLFVIRIWLQNNFVLATPYQFQAKRQFIQEFVLFFLAGVIAKLCLVIFHGGPFFGGFLVGFISLTLGFFAATDLALEREYIVSQQFKTAGQEILLGDRIFPLSKKFAFSSSFIVFMLILILAVMIFKNLNWTNTIPIEELAIARERMLLQFIVFGSIMMLEILNLIQSYCRNLKLFFANQNEVFAAVAGGDLENMVPVSTRDEFGVMAKYTNLMIQELKARIHEIQTTQDVTILSLATTAELRDPETGAHIRRTQRYVKELANELKNLPGYQEVLTSDNIELLFKSAPLHDIGKVGVPDAILLKPGKLTDEEFEVMKKHATYGRGILRDSEKLLGSSSFLRFAKEIAYTHHEKWDGTGYPQGLQGETIPVSGRLMALADVYDALISKRVYKESFSHEDTVNIICEGKGKHFDPAMVDGFIRIEKKFREIAEKLKET